MDPDLQLQEQLDSIFNTFDDLLHAKRFADVAIEMLRITDPQTISTQRAAVLISVLTATKAAEKELGLVYLTVYTRIFKELASREGILAKASLSGLEPNPEVTKSKKSGIDEILQKLDIPNPELIKLFDYICELETSNLVLKTILEETARKPLVSHNYPLNPQDIRNF